MWCDRTCPTPHPQDSTDKAARLCYAGRLQPAPRTQPASPSRSCAGLLSERACEAAQERAQRNTTDRTWRMIGRYTAHSTAEANLDNRRIPPETCLRKRMCPTPCPQDCTRLPPLHRLQQARFAAGRRSRPKVGRTLARIGQIDELERDWANFAQNMSNACQI